MRILLILILLAFMTGCVTSVIVTGYSGGSVIIYCRYYRAQGRHEKYFCRGPKNTLSCGDKIRSGSQNTWEHSGRFSLYDDTEEKYFTVVIRQLTRQDKGIYWCGVDKRLKLDEYTKVDLEVKEDKCCKKSFTETVHLGGEVDIVCNYPEKQENSNKYFCKEDNDSKTCDYRISDENHSSLKNGKYSLGFYNKKVEKSFTVTISNLTEDDTGTYWCGVENKKSGEHYISLITEVHLSVTVPNTTTTTTTTTKTTTTTTNVLPSSSSAVNRPGTPCIILVCVSLVVLLLVIGLLIVYRWKHNKTAFSSAKKMESSIGINGEGRHGDSDYEEMERPVQSDRGSITATNYTTADFPRNPSDSLHYANVTFLKNPSCPNEATTTISKEDTSCVYATVNVDQNSTYSTVNHPHSYSEAPPIYSTVSKPRNT